MSYKKLMLCLTLWINAAHAFSQGKVNDFNTPLHLMKPDYPVPYGAPSVPDVKKVIDRVYSYLESSTPAQFINKKTGAVVNNLANADTNTAFKPGDFNLTSYEWGVTYAGMLHVAKATGDGRYAAYTQKRLGLLADAAPVFKELFKKYNKRNIALRQIVDPHALDDAGAMCAAVVKAIGAGGQSNLRQLADGYIDYVANKEFRLPDGTLARNRPQKNTLWLDDLFMSVPALAQMGKLTGDSKYFDDAAKQVLHFSERMFNKEKNVYMHGWVEGMSVHPQFHWGRANGWAFMAMAELLDVLPQDHQDRKKVLDYFQALAKGLAAYQSGEGFWHQLLDKNDSYLETSATAIYTYCYAKGVNNGWLDPLAYSPMALLAWNAVATKVNAKGQVEGTCVGTGMGFDPAFYYYRPVNVYAAHGYGPVLLAGAEIITLLKNNSFEINDSSVQLKK